MTRFKELRKKLGLTQEELINQFNLKYGKNYTAAAISQFENGKRIPETKALMDFANFFDVSVDYLLGLTELKHCSAYSKGAPKVFNSIKKNMECEMAKDDTTPELTEATAKEIEYLALQVKDIKEMVMNLHKITKRVITPDEQVLLDAYRNASERDKNLVDTILRISEK